MPSERIQRRIDAFLDEADEAASVGNWAAVLEKARAVLAIDGGSEDAVAFLKMAEANGATGRTTDAGAGAAVAVPPPEAQEALPASFVAGRYRVLRLLGEGGRKRV